MPDYGLVKTEDGREWYVDDLSFARAWLRDQGWLSVSDFAFGMPHTIRHRPDKRHLDGLPLEIASIEPISEELFRQYQAEARATYDPVKGV